MSGPELPEEHPIEPQIEAPTTEVEASASTSALPGEHRGGFARLPTAPVGIAEELALPSPTVEWLIPEPARPYRGIAGWALAFSVIGLAASLFVGWGFPLGLVGVVSAIIALFRPLESRPIAIWALVMGSVSVLFSAGWLLWAASRFAILG